METPFPPFILSSTQLRSYLSHINLSSYASHPPPPSLPWLSKLIRHHLSSVPFENLGLHYSKTHLLSLDPAKLYTKVVERSRGGGCAEVNRLFGLLLTALGFEVSMHGARVHATVGGGDGDWYNGWTHMVSLVYLDGQSYHVDVAFGALGPTKPLPLRTDVVTSGIGPQEYCLLREQAKMPGQGEGLWVYKQRTSKDHPFIPLYAFASVPYLPQDYDIIVWYCSTNPASWFTWKIVCIKFILEGEELVGTVVMDGNHFHTTRKGKKESLMMATREEERVEGLGKYFGIQFNEQEREGIEGMKSKL